MNVLISLAIVFTQLSLMAFGGGNAVLPEMQHQVVEVHHWMTAQQFSYMFALAQAAPGPNMMIVPLVGWHVAGPMGLVVTSIAKFAPSSIITLIVVRYWDRFKQHPARAKLETALKPITVSLILVSAWLIAETSLQNPLLISILILSTLLSLIKNIHPFYVMILAAGIAAIML